MNKFIFIIKKRRREKIYNFFEKGNELFIDK